MGGLHRSVSNFETFYMVSIIETMKSSLYSSHYEKLGTWLKQCRENSGLTLREVAEVSGLDHSILCKMELNQRKIEIIEFVRYCRVLGVDPYAGLAVIVQSIEEDPSEP